MAKYKKIVGIEVDSIIKAAIDRACSQVGNVSELARRINVSLATPRMWMGEGVTRPVKTIPHATYERLYPLIRAHLPPGDARYLPQSKRPGSVAQAAAPVAAGVVGLSDTEQALIRLYRELSPIEQARQMVAMDEAVKESRQRHAPMSEAVSA